MKSYCDDRRTDHSSHSCFPLRVKLLLRLRPFVSGRPHTHPQVEDHVAAHGPFGVLVGFSQGAILASVLTAYCLQREREGGRGPSWQMNLLVCAMVPRDRRWIDLMEAQPLDFPASIVVGKQDRFFQDGLRLSSLYVTPQLYQHEGGHDFPALKDATHGEWMHGLRSRLEIDSRPQ